MAEDFSTYTKDELKKRLYLSVVRRSEEAGEFQNIPNEVAGEYALIPRFFVGKKNSDGLYDANAVLTNDLMESIGFQIEDVLEACRENSREYFPGKIVDISTEEMSGEYSALIDGLAFPKAYAVVSVPFCEESAVMFYQPEMLDNISDMLEKDLAVLQGSTGMSVCIGVKNEQEISEIRASKDQMVAEAEEKQEHSYVNDISVMYYSRNAKTLTCENGETIDLSVYAAYTQGVSRRGR